MQRNTGLTEALTVEYGFLDSKKDDVNQLKNNYQNYAEAVVRAILEYIGIDNIEDTYTVKSGDTLYKIANKFNISVSKLKELNNLDSDILSIGQKLIVKDDIVSENIEDYETYIVKNNDTLYGIAKKYNVKVDDIIKLNNLNSNMLSINQKLLIPKGEELIEQNKMNYIVKKGDTLYSISKEYNVDVDDLIKENNLTSNILSIGDILTIPLNELDINSLGDYITYTVKSGDTLYKISKDYDISIDELMDYNGLTTNILSIGSIIKIPKTTSTNRYIVKKGDSIYSIAKKFNKSVDEIKLKNNLTNTLLRIGQVLII